MLDAGAAAEVRPIHVGVRVEHPQRLIDNARATSAARAACQPGSRWRRYALSKLDESKTLEIEADGSTGKVLYRVDGLSRRLFMSSGGENYCKQITKVIANK